MAVTSAGLLIYREVAGARQFLLVHPGGPFWRGKQEAAWSIPKGIFEAGEDPLAAAIRETGEELGITLPGPYEPLGTFRQPGGKLVMAWVTEAPAGLAPDPAASNLFEMEWPPRSGRMQSFPEVDACDWFDAQTAETRLHKGLRPILRAFHSRSC